MIATTLNLQLFPARQISSRSRRKLPQRTLTVTSRGDDLQLSDSFLTSLATVADAGDDSATRSLIRKFVKSSSQKASYISLQRLLSIDDCSFANIFHLALPLYTQITEASWFTWNPKLAAEVIALLEKQGLHRESLILFSDAVSKTKHREKKVACLYSNLVIFHSKHKNKSGFDDSCTRLAQTLRYTNSSMVRHQGYESLVNGFCEMGQPREAENVIKEMTEKGFMPSKRVLRYVACLYWNLDNSHSKDKNKSEFDDSCSRLTQILRYTNSSKVRCQIYESLIVEFCKMGQPREAEDVIKEMTEKGFMPSKRAIRYVVCLYGQLGLLEDLLRSVKKMEQAGIVVDIICYNTVLTAYRAHGKLAEMVDWLRVMKSSGIEFSIRTYNTVLKSCPMFMSLLQDLKTLPISLEGLEQVLDSHESLAVKELVGSSVLQGSMVWGDTEVKLDLHKMNSKSAYLIMLQWMQEMQHRLGNGNCSVPAEVLVITGSGKHSFVKGKSPLKEMVKELMIRTESPMKIDSKNSGCFVAKGEDVKNWLDSFVKIA